MKTRSSHAAMTLGERLIATGGRPSGFDYLRLGLAVAVVVVHSRSTSFGPGRALETMAVLDGAAGSPVTEAASCLLVVAAGLIIAFHRAILPMFFVLSGFLVAGSLERSKTLLTFLGLRVIRIYPALAVEVVLSAFVIGASVTTLPLQGYFRDPLFSTYLLNAIGDIHFYLPGVFKDNPWPGVVNFQLWTVPFELLCYVALAVLILLGGIRRRIMIPLAAAGLGLGDLIGGLGGGEMHRPTFGGHFSGSLLIASFLAGVALYLYRDKVSWSLYMFIGALIASIPLLWLVPCGDYLAIATLAYVTTYLGLTNFTRLPVIKGADYSYGIYLYGFVIQQLFVYLAAPRYWWINALVCVPLAALFAAFSWICIERPAQSLRKPLAAVERRYLLLKDRLWTRMSFADPGTRRYGEGRHRVCDSAEAEPGVGVTDRITMAAQPKGRAVKI